MAGGLLSSFVPEDRLAALATGDALRESAQGAVLFVDVAGFTPLTDTLVASLGPQRGAEELTLLLNRVFAGLVEAVEWMGGSVVAFAGDALTCWFDGDDGFRAATAGMAMQQVMRPLLETPLPDGSVATLTTRAAVAAGTVTRMLLGDPAVQVIEGLAGAPVVTAAAGQQRALPGEVVVEAATGAALEGRVVLRPQGGYAVVTQLRDPFTPVPPQDVEPPAPDALRPWIPRAVFDSGGAPMAEIRPAVALFLGLDGVASVAALDACVRRTQSVLQSFGGTLIDVATDDKGTYLKGAFGVPAAHGDDLLRAVTAAHELRTPPPGIEAVRLGLAAGPVYASVFGAPRRRCYGLNGTTLNIAARLMQLAPPGGVRLSGGFGAGTARRFQIRTLPPLVLKGYAAPVPAAELVGPRDDGAVMPAEPLYTVPLVGRRAELRRALAAIRQASSGQGQLLGVCGEAGIGKSRLLAEIARMAAGFETFAGAGDPFATVPYLAWRRVWRELLDLEAIDPAQRPLLGPVLGQAIPDNEFTGPIPVAARKPIVHAILRACLAARAARGPLLILIEDCHWLDSLSLELLAEVGGWAGELPVLVVAAYRPEFRPLGAELRLAPLDEREAAELIELKVSELSGLAGDVPADLVQRVTERADGNPFFVEELLTHLHELGDEDVELPSSLHSLILQRLDRLPPLQHHALKPAAVIGRRFRIDWVQALEPELEDVASSFEAAARLDLIASDASEPSAYLFKHIATWEAVYQSIPFAARALWHRALATRLEADHDVAPALLAYHFRHAGERAQELRYALAAGEQAVAHGAYREATAMLERGLELVRPEDPPAIALALELSLGNVLLTTHGQASPEAKAHFDRALELSGHVAPVRALFGLWTYYLFRGDVRRTDELARQILAASDDPEALLQAHFAVSATVYWLGDFAGCVTHADEVDRLYDPAQADRYLATYAQNPRITAAADAAWAEWIMGRADSARRRAAATVAHARELDQPFPLTIALQVPAIVALHMGDVAATASAAGEWLECAQRVGNPVYIGLAAACLAWAHGDIQGLAAVRQRFLDEGVGIVDHLLVTALADAYLRAGERCSRSRAAGGHHGGGGGAGPACLSGRAAPPARGTLRARGGLPPGARDRARAGRALLRAAGGAQPRAAHGRRGAAARGARRDRRGRRHTGHDRRRRAAGGDTMTVLDAQALDDIACGACVLGSGGGGALTEGRALAKSLPAITLVEARDVPDDARMAVSAAIGSPTAAAGQDLSSAAVAAYEELAKANGAAFTHVLVGEIGAVNALIPMLPAAKLGLPVIDASSAPRALPLLANAIFADTVPISPITLATANGTFTIRTSNAETADPMLRGLVSSPGFPDCAGFALWSMDGATMKRLRAAGHRRARARGRRAAARPEAGRGRLPPARRDGAVPGPQPDGAADERRRLRRGHGHDRRRQRPADDLRAGREPGRLARRRVGAGRDGPGPHLLPDRRRPAVLERGAGHGDDHAEHGGRRDRRAGRAPRLRRPSGRHLLRRGPRGARLPRPVRPGGRVSDRETLIGLLCEAAETEHMLCCQYLFAGVSLKTEGLTFEQQAVVHDWGLLLFTIAREEMEHLGLVCNLLTSIGAAPHFARPNFPQGPKYFPVPMTLECLSEASIRRFIRFEHPATGDPEVGTIEHLYDSISRVLDEIPLSDAELFIGPPNAQVDGNLLHVNWPRPGALGGIWDVTLFDITDRATAHQAIDLIIEQGEGSPGDSEFTHYRWFCEMLEQFEGLARDDPAFDPARPVVSESVPEPARRRAADHGPRRARGARPLQRHLRAAPADPRAALRLQRRGHEPDHGARLRAVPADDAGHAAGRDAAHDPARRRGRRRRACRAGLRDHPPDRVPAAQRERVHAARRALRAPLGAGHRARHRAPAARVDRPQPRDHGRQVPHGRRRHLPARAAPARDRASLHPAVMLQIGFRGWWQLRMALDPDPNDEPVGISGPTVVAPGEPEFDGIIRLNDPVSPRFPHEHDIGVSVHQVMDVDPAGVEAPRVLPDHPLLGARVNLLDEPTFGERGFVVLYQKMPIEPFHLEVATDGIVLRCDDLWDPTRPELTYDEIAASDPALLERRSLSVQPQSALVAEVTGIVDYAAYRLERRRALEALRAASSDEVERAALALRIRMLAKDELMRGNEGLVGLTLPAQQFLGLCGFYAFPIQGVPSVADPEGRLGGVVGTSQPWSVQFWMGGFDVDALTGYMMGSLTVPFFTAPEPAAPPGHAPPGPAARS